MTINKFFNVAETNEKVIDYLITSFDYVNFDLYRTDETTLVLAKNYDNDTDYSENVVKITSLNISGEDTVTTSSSIILSAVYEPEDSTSYNLVWSIDNTSIASITQDGVLTATESGDIVVTLTDTISRLTATKNVTSTKEVIDLTDIQISDTSNSVKVGRSLTLSIVKTPTNANNYSLVWSSSDETKATVSNGVVTGVDIGSVTITVTDEVSGLTDSLEISVNENTESDILEEYPQYATYFDEYQEEYPYHIAIGNYILMSSKQPTCVVATAYNNQNYIIMEDVYDTSKLMNYNADTNTWNEITSTAYKTLHGTNNVGVALTTVTSKNFYDAILDEVIMSSENIYDATVNSITDDIVLSDIKNHLVYDVNRVIIYPTICETYEFLKTYYERYAHCYPYYVYNATIGRILMSETKSELTGFGSYNYNNNVIMKGVYDVARVYDANWENKSNSTAYMLQINTTDVGILASQISDIVASTEDIYAISDVTTMTAGEQVLTANV